MKKMQDFFQQRTHFMVWLKLKSQNMHDIIFLKKYSMTMLKSKTMTINPFTRHGIFAN